MTRRLPLLATRTQGAMPSDSMRAQDSAKSLGQPAREVDRRHPGVAGAV